MIESVLRFLSRKIKEVKKIPNVFYNNLIWNAGYSVIKKHESSII